MPHALAVPDVRALQPYVDAGYALFPLNRWNFVDRKGRKRGKSPRDARWRQIDYPLDEVLAWVGRGGNVGVRLAETDVVIDVDPRNLPPDKGLSGALADFEQAFDCALSAFPCVVTGSGGLHYYGKLPTGFRVSNTLAGFPGFEFKSLGRLVVAAGALHPDGGRYDWEPLAPALADAPELPPALLAAIGRPADQVPAPSSAPSEIGLEQALECLDQIDVFEYRGHDDWLELMMAFHSATGGAEDAREAFVRWSVADPNYASDADTIRSRWDSLKANRADGVGLGTLYHHVLDAGGTIPAPPPESDFDPIPDDVAEPYAPKFERDKNGKPKPTVRNAREAVRGLGLDPAYDVFRRRIVLLGDLRELRVSYASLDALWDDEGAHVIRAAWIDRYRLEVGIDRTHEAITAESLRRPFNPVTDYLDSVKWDGTERIGRFLTTHAQAQDTPYTRAASRLLFLGAVGRAYAPGIKFDLTVVLESAQGTGKSTLAGILGGEFAAEGVPAKEIGDRDVVDALQGKWIVELAELAAVRRSDVESLKAFLSRQTDRARLAYQRVTKDYPRRCVFVGTTNDSTYLMDSTGNRRFLPVAVGVIDLGAVERDRDQLWAEAVAAWRANPSRQALELPEHLRGMAAVEQERRRAIDPWEEAAADFLAKKPDLDTFSSEVLLWEVAGKTPQNATKGDYARLATVMQRLGLEKGRAYVGDGDVKRQVRGWKR